MLTATKIRLYPTAGQEQLLAPLTHFLERYPQLSVQWMLNDKTVYFLSDGIDCAIRIGELSDSSLVSVRLGDNRRVVVASPAYLARSGTPAHPDDLARHDCLSLDPQRGWVFSDPDTPGQTRTIKVSGRFECNDGTVLHDWAVGGIGLAWRSMWLRTSSSGEALGRRMSPDRKSVV